MMQAIFHPAAGRELEEAIDHYNAERQGLGGSSGKKCSACLRS